MEWNERGELSFWFVVARGGRQCTVYAHIPVHKTLQHTVLAASSVLVLPANPCGRPVAVMISEPVTATGPVILV